jgi:hypothetical protein
MQGAHRPRRRGNIAVGKSRLVIKTGKIEFRWPMADQRGGQRMRIVGLGLHAAQNGVEAGSSRDRNK